MTTSNKHYSEHTGRWPLLTGVVKKGLRGVLNLLFRVEIKGLENFHTAEPPILIVSNHVSFLDPVILGAYLPSSSTYAINTRIANQPFVKFSASLLATVFEMDPTNPLSAKALVKYLKEGNRAIIFPEGRISTTGTLMKIYDGTAMIAEKSGAQLLPVRIDGAQYSFFAKSQLHFRQRWFPKITVTILPARSISPPAELKASRARREITGRMLTDTMVNMIFETSHYQRDLFSALLQARVIHGGKALIVEDLKREPLSYNQLITRSLLIGNLLAKHVAKQENVGILLPNSTAHVCTLFGLFAQQRIPAILNVSVGRKAITSACETACVKSIITSKQFVEAANLEEIVDSLAQSRKIIYLEDLRDSLTRNDKVKALIQSKTTSRWYPDTAPDPHAPAVILFTSGSEGTPKGVVLSHANLMANREQIAACCDFSGQDRVLNALPMFHSFGLTAGTLLPILYGMSVFLYPSPLHYRIVPEFVYENRATILFGTNTFLNGYSKHAHPYDFNTVRYIFAGAEKLQQKTRDTWAKKFGIRLLEGYGATETAPALSLNTPMFYKEGSVGRLLPGISYQLEAVEGISNGSRLHVAGPNIMLGYLLHDNPGQLVPPTSIFGEGWYDTGDIISIDEEGYLHICGRAKRFAKIGGEMVSLAISEQIASEAWPEALHASISIPDETKGERIILITNQADATRATLCEHADGVGEINLPKEIIVINDMPILASGKINYPAVDTLIKQQKAS